MGLSVFLTFLHKFVSFPDVCLLQMTHQWALPVSGWRSIDATVEGRVELGRVILAVGVHRGIVRDLSRMEAAWVSRSPASLTKSRIKVFRETPAIPVLNN